MQQHPDSTLSILTAMATPSPAEEAHYATWCLLLTQAKDKNYIRHTSDSLIQVAVRYFEKQNDLQRKAMALYYAGRVQDELYNKVEAAKYCVLLNIVEKTKHFLTFFATMNYSGYISPPI